MKSSRLDTAVTAAGNLVIIAAYVVAGLLLLSVILGGFDLIRDLLPF